jgi:hypothetical protein
MRILVATEETQGRRPNDFCFAEEGEVVTFSPECTREEVDGPCGCKRSLSGTTSLLATTTFRVVERDDLTPAGLTRILAASLVAGGWYETAEAASGPAREEVVALVRVALRFPAGSVLERRGDRFATRLRLVA